MKSDSKFFKRSKILPIDEFFKNVLYDNKFGYYTTRQPLGDKGDFITAPKISNLFSEIIAIWIVSVWEKFGKPKKFNIVELGPGDGSLTKSLLNSFRSFKAFNEAKKIFLYEESDYLRKIQKLKINNKYVKWIKSFDKVKKGPVIFFGNEFFDAIPIKQFKKTKGTFFEKNYQIDKNYKIVEIFKKTSKENIKMIKSYKTLKNLYFVEFPKLGLEELEKIVRKISTLTGCILMIDYGYLKSHNQSTLQSVMKHKKNNLLENLGRADITSHVNFELLSEFFLKKKFKVKNIITQKQFLEKMGIIERAKVLSKNMKFKEQSDLYLRLERLLSPTYMGNLFKVFLAYKWSKKN